MRRTSFQKDSQLLSPPENGSGVSRRTHRITPGKSRVWSEELAQLMPGSSGLVQTHPADLPARCPKVSEGGRGA